MYEDLLNSLIPEYTRTYGKNYKSNEQQLCLFEEYEVQDSNGTVKFIYQYNQYNQCN